MEEERELFRKQVVDELNNKLNGDVLLVPSITIVRLLLFVVLWLLLIGAVCHFIEIHSSRSITGELVLLDESNLVAKFMLPVDFAYQVSVGEIIPVQLLGISEIEHLNANIKISKIDKTLSVFGDSYPSFANVASLSVSADLMGSTVLVQGQNLSLSEGIKFSFYLDDQPQKLFPWLLKYFSGGA